MSDAAKNAKMPAVSLVSFFKEAHAESLPSLCVALELMSEW